MKFLLKRASDNVSINFSSCAMFGLKFCLPPFIIKPWVCVPSMTYVLLCPPFLVMLILLPLLNIPQQSLKAGFSLPYFISFSLRYPFKLRFAWAHWQNTRSRRHFCRLSCVSGNFPWNSQEQCSRPLPCKIFQSIYSQIPFSELKKYLFLFMA